MEGAECRRGTGTVVVSVGYYMACSERRMLSAEDEQENLVVSVGCHMACSECRVLSVGEEQA